MVPKPAARKAKATARRPGRVRSDERLQPSSARPLLPRSAGRTAGTARCIPDRACPDRNLAPRRAGHGVELREEFSNYGKKYVIRPEDEERTHPAVSELSMSSALDQLEMILGAGTPFRAFDANPPSTIAHPVRRHGAATGALPCEL